jgi:hypothetical protein
LQLDGREEQAQLCKCTHGFVAYLQIAGREH